MSTDAPTQKNSVRTKLALLPVTLLGFALRLPLLDSFPFREDEAIYAYWALHAWHEDPLFLTVWPDKPPLFIWLLSGAFQLFGSTPASARWINIALSTLTIPVVAATTRRLTPSHGIAPLIAATTLALNPFAISFAPTAFTDPMLVFCGMLALCLALYRRPFWAGVWLAAAIMTKQQGIFYVPLVVGVLLTYRARLRRAAIYFFAGLLLICLPILYWDSLRWAVAPSPWDLSVRNYGALSLLPPIQWFERALVWGELLWYLLASWWAWGALAGVGLWSMGMWRMAVWFGGQRGLPPPNLPQTRGGTVTGHPILQCIRRAWISRGSPLSSKERARVRLKHCRPDHIVTHLIILWTLAFTTIHITTTIQPWDRYLLPLAPILALLAGCAFGRLVDPTSPARTSSRFENGAMLGPCRGRNAAIIWIALLLIPAVRAANGAYPIGGDHGAYAGLDDAIAWIDAQADERMILYHRALGWHYRFYLYEQIRAGKVDLRWFPHAVYLADNAAKTSHRRRFVIEPAWSPVRDLAQHAATRQINLDKRAQFGDFVLLELAHPPQGDCDWCVCRVLNSWLTETNVQNAADQCPANAVNN